MRTSSFLLSAILLTAACNDATETTGPRSRANISPAADVLAAPSAELPPGPGATLKPSTAFTTITSVDSPMGIFNGPGGMWLSTGTITASCPVGSKVIAGGHTTFGLHPQDLRINVSKPNAANGWMMTVENVGSSVSQARIIVTAICVS